MVERPNQRVKARRPLVDRCAAQLLSVSRKANETHFETFGVTNLPLLLKVVTPSVDVIIGAGIRRLSSSGFYLKLIALRDGHC